MRARGGGIWRWQLTLALLFSRTMPGLTGLSLALAIAVCCFSRACNEMEKWK